MSLPPNFQFSQASLGDYVDCARRFQLRYLLEQDWPAVESEPLLERERLADLGRRFHKLIQQHIEGLPVDALTRSLGEAELSARGALSPEAPDEHRQIGGQRPRVGRQRGHGDRR